MKAPKSIQVKKLVLVCGYLVYFISIHAQPGAYRIPEAIRGDSFKEKLPRFENRKTNEDLFEALDEAFDIASAEMLVKGLSAALITPDGEVWERAAGVSHEEPSEAELTTDHLMGIASNTKSYVSATIMLMVEDGLLNLDDPIGNYLEPIPNVSGEATIRQILGMRSGFGGYIGPDIINYLLANSSTIFTPEELLTNYLGSPYFGIDENWGYSNTNYVLAVMVIEAITGNTWYSEVRNRVLDPLNLTETYCFPFEQPDSQELAHYWGYDGDLNQNGNFIDLTTLLNTEGFFSVASGAGCIWSTAEDLAKYRKALHGGELLQDESYAEMTINYSPEVQGLSYGLGIDSNLLTPEEEWGHGGSWIFQSTAYYFPEYDFSIATIQNDSRFPEDHIFSLFETLKNIYFDYSESLSVDEISGNEIQLYPNPSSETLNIDFEGTFSDLKLQSVLGNTVSENLQKGSNELLGLPQGQYILTGFADGIPFSKRLMILK